MAGGSWLAGVAPVAGQQDAPARRETHELQRVERQPRLLNHDVMTRQLAASYPPALRDGGVTGDVLLRFRIFSDGSVDSASISVVQVTNAAFAAPAAAVVRSLRFTPATVRGRPVAVWYVLPLYFRSAPLLEAPRDETYALSEVEERPTLRNGEEISREMEARYPPALVDSAVTGDVELRFRILENGRVDPETVTVERATNPAFAEPAVAVVRRMRFAPAKIGGRGVPVWVTIPIHFGLEGPP